MVIHVLDRPKDNNTINIIKSNKLFQWNNKNIGDFRLKHYV